MTRSEGLGVTMSQRVGIVAISEGVEGDYEWKGW